MLSDDWSTNVDLRLQLHRKSSLQSRDWTTALKGTPREFPTREGGTMRVWYYTVCFNAHTRASNSEVITLLESHFCR